MIFGALLALRALLDGTYHGRDSRAALPPLPMERVLVTGATGFTGSHLVRHLVAGGESVRIIARDRAKAHGMFPGNVEICAGDITDPAVIERAMDDVSVVYHLAAAFREPGLPDSRYREVHVDATLRLLEAARTRDVRRFLHCSTIGVHSHIANPPADETWPHTPGDIYQATKSEGEQAALAFHQSHGLPVTVIRPAGIYGPGDMRLLKLFRAVARKRFVMLGSGRVYFHMVHVRDLVKGMQLAAMNDDAIGEIFILGGENYCTLNELVERIARAVGVRPPRLHLPVLPFYAAGALCEAICVPLGIEPIIYRRRVAFFTKSRAFRIDKAKRMLGYAPEVSLDEGIAETLGWYREQHLL